MVLLKSLLQDLGPSSLGQWQRRRGGGKVLPSDSAGYLRTSIPSATLRDGCCFTFTVTIAEPDLEETAKLAAALETWKQLIKRKKGVKYQNLAEISIFSL